MIYSRNALIQGCLLLSCLVFMTFSVLASEKPKPFTATYETSFSGLPITAVRSLKNLDNGQQELRFTAKSWLASIEEFSHFTWSKEGNLVPQLYEYHREGLGRDRHAVLSFDWEDNKVTNNVQNKPWVMELPELALDKLSYQEQLRRDLINDKPAMRYAVADGGRIKHYLFKTMGEEVLETPIGKFHTIKVKRVREKNNNRITYLWLAKDWNYLLIRINQRKKNGKPYEITLANAEIEGIPVKGF